MQIPTVGDVLAGKYAVEGVVGRGGMGVVLAARHLELDERVAIKLILADEGPSGAEFVLSASLSAAQAHEDRLPLIQSSVSVSIEP